MNFLEMPAEAWFLVGFIFSFLVCRVSPTVHITRCECQPVRPIAIEPKQGPQPVFGTGPCPFCENGTVHSKASGLLYACPVCMGVCKNILGYE